MTVSEHVLDEDGYNCLQARRKKRRAPGVLPLQAAKSLRDHSSKSKQR